MLILFPRKQGHTMHDLTRWIFTSITIGICTSNIACSSAFCQSETERPNATISDTAAKKTGNEELIPRQVLFGNPKRATPRLSPNGKYLAYRAAKDGVMNVWVAPIDDIENAKCVTDDKSTGIAQYFWAYTNNHILYLQDSDGDEDDHLYCVDLQSGEVKDLTPFEKIKAQMSGISHRFPNEVLVGINDRNQHYFHDLYKINIVTGDRQLVIKNDSFVGFVADDDYNIKLALTFTPSAEMIMFKADESAEMGWSPIATVGSEDVLTTAPAGFNKSGDKYYMLDSRGRNTAALTEVDLASGESKEIFATDKADVSGVLAHPTENTIEAVAFTYAKTQWHVLDEKVREDLNFLATVCDGELQVSSRTLDDTAWIVSYIQDDGPVQFYRYLRADKKADFLFSHRPELEEIDLAKMHPVVIKSRDGLDLVSYLTLPVGTDTDADGRPEKPLPMILLVHGGPWARDSWGYNPLHQLLADRGYAVLSVNYRGSTGLGKKFINAANGEWAGKMHDDLIDAVNWAVDQQIAVKEKIGIMGGSYGGYATLVGLTFTPETFACGVDIVGPSSLISLMNNPPPYWMPIMPLMKARVGDYETEAGKEYLKSRSPLFHVEKIRRPLLIGQGAKDPRVKQAESDQIVEAMESNKIPVTYVLFPEEGHGFDRPENDISFYAITEAFLAEHLGGRYEPIGDAFEGAKFSIPAGASLIPGLSTSGAGK
jgi:dipeptidyl aminopeptidase/acylaminoacyl peptidase